MRKIHKIVPEINISHAILNSTSKLIDKVLKNSWKKN